MAVRVFLKNFMILAINSIFDKINRIKVVLGFSTEKYGLCNPFKYKGIWFSPVTHSMERLKASERYDNFRPDDVIVATYPKTGTHFVSEMIISIYKQLDLVPQGFGHFEVTSNLEIERPAQFIKPTEGEDEGALVGIEAPESPRILITHLPWEMHPPSVREGKVKTIHCTRNPKDVLCSMFPFYKKYNAIPSTVTMDEFLQWYIQGNVLGGDYFQHLRQWYPHRHSKNMLSLQFEDMTKDLKGNVEKIAKFLNLKLTDQQVEAVAVSNIFENKKKERGVNNPIYRKGKAGGWKSEITVEQNEILDEWIQREMQGLEDLPMQYS